MFRGAQLFGMSSATSSPHVRTVSSLHSANFYVGKNSSLSAVNASHTFNASASGPTDAEWPIERGTRIPTNATVMMEIHTAYTSLPVTYMGAIVDRHLLRSADSM